LISSLLHTLLRPVARRLQGEHMRLLGIHNTMRLAHAYNRLKFGRQDAWRRGLYRTHIAALLEENGLFTRPPIAMRDGWAIDTSMSLPHLDRVLEDSEKIIAERSGVRRKAEGTFGSYFQDMWMPADADRYPSFLDFATSTDVLSTISHYLRCIPALSTTPPSGVRFVESNAAFDDQPSHPHDSQLYHIDYDSLRSVYVLVLLRDTSFEHGPWTFLPRSLSRKVQETLEYGKRGKPYRLSDEEVYSIVDRYEAVEFAYPRGTVLFIESSSCFHFSSRNAIRTGFQLMYAYTGACRTDFSETIMKPKVYPIRDTGSQLRKMVLDKNLLPLKPRSRQSVNGARQPHFGRLSGRTLSSAR
jgi:hypothetical protein